MGTIINVLFILIGGTFGRLFGKHINDRMKESILIAIAIAVIMLGVSGVLTKMIVIKDNKLESQGEIMLITSLAIGTVIGEILDLDRKIFDFGTWLKEKSGSGDDDVFVSSFVAASCTVCIGAMAVVGAIEDGVSGNYSILLAKSILDAIVICIMATSQSKGPIFSAIPVLIFQGTITIIAIFMGNFFSQAALFNLSLVGNVLIICVGINLAFSRNIRIANLLPAIFVSAIFGALKIL